MNGRDMRMVFGTTSLGRRLLGTAYVLAETVRTDLGRQFLMKKAARTKSNGNGTNLGFEATLWLAADKLCSTMDAGEYTHVVPGLIFIKYMSDAFQELHQQFVAETSQGADPDDPDEYCAENVFWVPPQARWEFLQANARQSSIGELVENVPPKGNATL